MQSEKPMPRKLRYGLFLDMIFRKRLNAACSESSLGNNIGLGLRMDSGITVPMKFSIESNPTAFSIDRASSASGPMCRFANWSGWGEGVSVSATVFSAVSCFFSRTNMQVTLDKGCFTGQGGVVAMARNVIQRL